MFCHVASLRNALRCLSRLKRHYARLFWQLWATWRGKAASWTCFRVLEVYANQHSGIWHVRYIPWRGFQLCLAVLSGASVLSVRFRRATARCESKRGHALRLPREHYCRLCAEFPQHHGYSTWSMHPVCWYFLCLEDVFSRNKCTKRVLWMLVFIRCETLMDLPFGLYR